MYFLYVKNNAYVRNNIKNYKRNKSSEITSINIYSKCYCYVWESSEGQNRMYEIEEANLLPIHKNKNRLKPL